MEQAIVVGGGIIGYSCALALVELGLRVHVVDDGQPGATDYAAGILLPLGIEKADPDLAELDRRAMQAWEEVDDNGLRLRCGKVKPGALEDLKTWQAGAEIYGLATEQITASEAQKLLPGLAAEHEAALWMPEASSIDPRVWVQHLRLRLLGRQGDALVPGRAVAVELQHDKASAVRLQNGRRLGADWVVAAGGFSSTEWLPEGCRPQLVAQMGERVLLELPEDRQQPMLDTPHGSLIPRRKAELWVGVTAREHDALPQPTAGGVAAILSNAVRWLPRLANCRVRDVGAGVRPLSRDGLPWVGPTECSGLLLATGHGRSGILHAPLAAATITSCISDGKLPAWSQDTSPLGRAA